MLLLWRSPSRWKGHTIKIVLIACLEFHKLQSTYVLISHKFATENLACELHIIFTVTKHVNGSVYVDKDHN